MNTTPPTFIGVFTQAHCFGSLNPTAIAEHVCATIHNDPEVMWDIYEIILHDASPQGGWALHKPDLILEHLIKTVRVDVINHQPCAGVSEPLVRLYMDLLTLHAGDWVIFRDRIMGLAFSDNLTGNPAIFAGTLWCTLCHSHNHTTKLCPLLVIPGWNGLTLGYPTLCTGLRQNDRVNGRAGRQGCNGQGSDRSHGDDHFSQRKHQDRDDNYAGGATSGQVGSSRLVKRGY